MPDKEKVDLSKIELEKRKKAKSRSDYLKKEVDSLYSVLGLAHLSDIKLNYNKDDLKDTNNHQGENNAK